MKSSVVYILINFFVVLRVFVYIIEMVENKNEIFFLDNFDDQLKFRDLLISGLDVSDGEVCILKIYSNRYVIQFVKIVMFVQGVCDLDINILMIKNYIM